MSYNGWSNYETWLVKLWIDNDQAEQEDWLRQAEDANIYHLGRNLKEAYQEAMPELSGVWADLLNAALSNVDWDEIAESLIGDAEELASCEQQRRKRGRHEPQRLP